MMSPLSRKDTAKEDPDRQLVTIGGNLVMPAPEPSSSSLDDVDDVWRALDAIDDPELGVPITDLGLVYEVDVDGDSVHVVMTTTTPICSLGVTNLDDKEVTVELVHEPLWPPEMMNDRARKALGWNDC